MNVLLDFYPPPHPQCDGLICSLQQHAPYIAPTARGTLLKRTLFRTASAQFHGGAEETAKKIRSELLDQVAAENMVGRGVMGIFDMSPPQSCLNSPVWSLEFLFHRKRMKKWSEEVFDKSWITSSRVFHQNRLHTESNFTTSTSLDKHLDIWQCIRKRYEDCPWLKSWIRGSLQPNVWDNWYF